MTPYVPIVIDLDGISGPGLAPPTLVGGLTPWDSEDGDTSYIHMVPSPGMYYSYFVFVLPPGLPEEWFYYPAYDLGARYAGTAPMNLIVSISAGFAFDGLLWGASTIPLGSTYSTVRHSEVGFTGDVPAFWALYSSGGDLFVEVLALTEDGDVGVPNPGLASVRITYFALWVNDPTAVRTPLRGRQRGAGSTGAIPLRGRNNVPAGLRGRQDSNF